MPPRTRSRWRGGGVGLAYEGSWLCRREWQRGPSEPLCPLPSALYGCPGVGACAGSLRFGSDSNPPVGGATYGKLDRNGLSFRSTPSPSGSFLPPWFAGSRNPPITRSSMSTTSSPRRRPFGKPALSPASTPKRFSVADGGTPRLIFSVSAAAGLLLIWLSPFTP